MTRLDRTGAIPLYLQVKDWLEQQIASGRLKPHRKVPSERQLSERFGISRMTVRQALTELVHDGRLYSRVGMGTFVAEPIIREPLSTSISIHEGFDEHESPVHYRVLRCELTLPPPAVAGLLNPKPRQQVLHLERLRVSDDQPLMIESSYFAFDGVDQLLTMDHSGSLYRTLDQSFGIRPKRTDQQISARRARPHEIALLGIDEETAVLEFIRSTIDSTGATFEHATSVYRGDRYQFVMQLDHEGGAGS